MTRLPPKQCLPKMISYLSQKYDGKKSHDQIVAIAASECGISKKDYYGFDTGIRAALHLARYKEKYSHLSLKDNLLKAYQKVVVRNDFVDFIVNNGQEGTMADALFQIKEDFVNNRLEDLTEEEALSRFKANQEKFRKRQKGEWKTIKGSKIFIEEGQTVSEAFKKRSISNLYKDINKKTKEKGNEHGYIIDGEGKSIEIKGTKAYIDPWEVRKIIKDLEGPIIFIHSHPNSSTFSPDDIASFILSSKIRTMGVINKEGVIYELKKPDNIEKYSIDMITKAKQRYTNARRFRKTEDSEENRDKAINYFIDKFKYDLTYKRSSITKDITENFINNLPKKTIIEKIKNKDLTEDGVLAKIKSAITKKPIQSKSKQPIPPTQPKTGTPPISTVTGTPSVTKPYSMVNTETGAVITGEVTLGLPNDVDQMQPVSSSNVKSAGRAGSSLVVAFHGGNEGKFYRYNFATPEMASEAREALINSPSPGRWIWHNMRGHVKGERGADGKVESSKIGPSLERGVPTIGGTTASLVNYTISKTAPSRVPGYKEATEKLKRDEPNLSDDPSTGARIEGLLGARKGFRELGRKIRQDLIVKNITAESNLFENTVEVIKNTQHSFLIDDWDVVIKDRVVEFHGNEVGAQVNRKDHQIDISGDGIEFAQLEDNWEERVHNIIRHELGHIYDGNLASEFSHENGIEKSFKYNKWWIEGSKYFDKEKEKYEQSENFTDKFISQKRSEFFAELFGRYFGTPKSRSKIKDLKGFTGLMNKLEKIRNIGKGRGWHGDPEGHSIAAKLGRKIRQDLTSDYTMTGNLTRSGEFDYRAEGGGIKTKTPENLKWVAENTTHVPVFGKRDKGSHQESDYSLIGFAHNFDYIPPNEVDEYAHISGDVELFYNISDLSDLEDPSNLPVSFGFDDIGEDYVQNISKLHHLAVSLNRVEKDRCSTMEGTPCTISPKIKDFTIKKIEMTTDFMENENIKNKEKDMNIHDQNFTEDALKTLQVDLKTKLGDGDLIELDGKLYYQAETKDFYEINFDTASVVEGSITEDLITTDEVRDTDDLHDLGTDSIKESCPLKKTNEKKKMTEKTKEDLYKDKEKDKEEEEKEISDTVETVKEVKEDIVKEPVKLDTTDFEKLIKDLVEKGVKNGLDVITKDFRDEQKKNEAKKVLELNDLLQKEPYGYDKEYLDGKTLEKLTDLKDIVENSKVYKDFQKTKALEVYEDIDKEIFNAEDLIPVGHDPWKKYKQDMGGSKQ